MVTKGTPKAACTRWYPGKMPVGKGGEGYWVYIC